MPIVVLKMHNNIPEVDFQDIAFHVVVGKGSFGVVWKGLWNGQTVAVKSSRNESERKAFQIELHQLSRVSHENIIPLFGVCTKGPNVCLIMEYAEFGSLSNLIHNDTNIYKYYFINAVSWLLQCAKGVSYLHNMKPKPLIHRDLKPANLLLFNGGKILKICDFGTVIDQSTYMTNNRGSAAWMAPEVFESCKYTEKCDIFSWGIILWEVLSRRKPFDRSGNSAFSIMWAVHKGHRPPLLKNCPASLENVLLKCWNPNPNWRPTIDELVNFMSKFHALLRLKFVKEPDVEVLQNVDCDSESCTVENSNEKDHGEAFSDDFTIFGIDRSRKENRSFSNSDKMFAETFQPLQIQLNSKVSNASNDSSERSNDRPSSVPLSLSSDTTNEKTLFEQFKPIDPDFTSLESLRIFNDHKSILHQFSMVHSERIRVSKQINEMLLANCDFDESYPDFVRIRELQQKNDDFIQLYHRLKSQLESISK